MARTYSGNTWKYNGCRNNAIIRQFRSGTTTDETVLTPAAVGTRGIRKLFSLNIPGDRRGIEGQPLAPGRDDLFFQETITDLTLRRLAV